MKDLEKRRRVMQRSMRLGHCICDPKTACPCEIFRSEDLCPCAGEEYAAAAGPVRLTELVRTAGCGSKIDQATLQRVLAGLPAPADPRVLVGMPAGDDAGVYLLDERTALVQTVDVFSPPVDDPCLFGRIAAANSLSDVYAMGGRPLTALSVVGFPAKKLPDAVLHEILRGGLDTMTEAGVAVIGGHSIQDDRDHGGLRGHRPGRSAADRHQRGRPAGRSARLDQAAGHGHPRFSPARSAAPVRPRPPPRPGPCPR